MKWYVVTPAYESWGDSREWGSDVVKVEARNRREARIVGIRELRQIAEGYLQRFSDKNPFKGLKVEKKED